MRFIWHGTLTWEQEEPAYPYYLAVWEFLVCLASVGTCNQNYITCYSWANYNLLYNYRDVAQANQQVNWVNRKSLFPLYWKSTFLTAPESLPCLNTARITAKLLHHLFLLKWDRNIYMRLQRTFHSSTLKAKLQHNSNQYDEWVQS